MTESALHRLIAVAIICVCFAFRDWLEQDPVTHILIQLPLLATAGWLLADSFRPHLPFVQGIDPSGGLGVLIALFAIAYWMLPRSIDAALDSSIVNATKFLSIPLLIGAPLALGWRRMHPLLRGFLKANTLSMLGIMAFLYTHAPVRICNNYLENDQERLGIGFLVVGLALALIWSIPAFTGTRSEISAGALQHRDAQA